MQKEERLQMLVSLKRQETSALQTWRACHQAVRGIGSDGGRPSERKREGRQLEFKVHTWRGKKMGHRQKATAVRPDPKRTVAPDTRSGERDVSVTHVTMPLGHSEMKNQGLYKPNSV